MLTDRIEPSQKIGQVEKKTPAKYKKDYPFLKEVDSFALSESKKGTKKAARRRQLWWR